MVRRMCIRLCQVLALWLIRTDSVDSFGSDCQTRVINTWILSSTRPRFHTFRRAIFRGSSTSLAETSTLQNNPGNGVVSLPMATVTSEFLGKFHQVSYPSAKTNDKDDLLASSSSFVASMLVPTFAATLVGDEIRLEVEPSSSSPCPVRRLDESMPKHGPTFVLDHLFPSTICRDLCQASEALGFANFQAGKNHHGALQIIVPETVADAIAAKLTPHIDWPMLHQRRRECEHIEKLASGGNDKNDDDEDEDWQLTCVGLNRRWRFYRYAPGGIENFAPHIDVGFPPSGLSADNQTLVWDTTIDRHECKSLAENERLVVSRLTVLFYLNDDFLGGETRFYHPLHACRPSQGDKTASTKPELKLLTAISPKMGSCLVFPQVIGDEASQYARRHWPLHEGSPVHADSLQPKYVIRSDLIFQSSKTKK